MILSKQRSGVLTRHCTANVEAKVVPLLWGGKKRGSEGFGERVKGCFWPLKSYESREREDKGAPQVRSQKGSLNFWGSWPAQGKDISSTWDTQSYSWRRLTTCPASELYHYQHSLASPPVASADGTPPHHPLAIQPHQKHTAAATYAWAKKTIQNIVSSHPKKSQHVRHHLQCGCWTHYITVLKSW